MRYSTEPKYRRYVIGYGFLPFAQKMVINMVKLMDTATKKGMDVAKTASKIVVQKSADTAGDLIGHKIADKITSVGESKEEDKTKTVEKIYVPSLTFLNWKSVECISHSIKMEFQKVVNLLNSSSDDKELPRFATKWIEVYDQKKIMWFQWYMYFCENKILLLQKQIMAEETKVLLSKIMHHLSMVFIKISSMVCKLTMQKI